MSLSFSQDESEKVVLKSSSPSDASEPIFAVSVADFQTGIIRESTSDHHEYEAAPLKLKAGKYIITATNGTNESAAFEQPFYVGKDTIEVVANTATTSTIVCSLSNVKVSVIIDNSVTNNFTDYVVTVSNGEKALVYDKAVGTLSKAGYYSCTDSLIWSIHLVNNNGTSYDIKDNVIKNVKPKEHYKLTFSVNETGNKNQGGASINLTYDETTNDKNHSLDISLNKKPVPTIKGNGFDIDNQLFFQIGSTTIGYVDVVAKAGFSSFIINHKSSELNEYGLPYSFDFMTITSEQKLQFNDAGLSWTTLNGETTEVTLDFRTILSKLPLGEYPIEISVLDNQSQYVEKTLNVLVIPDVEITTLSVDPYAKFAYLSAQWNTESKPEGIGFEYKKAADTQWTVATGTLSEDAKLYSLKLTGLDPNTNYQFRAISTADKSNIISFTTEEAAQVPFFNFDSWTKNGKNWYPNPTSDRSSADFWWDSGNEGANTLTEVNPTSPEETNVIKGKACKMVSSSVLGVLAGGNVYTGYFAGRTGTNAKVSFGRPFTSRPTSLHGYYSYAPVPIDKTRDPYTDLAGQNDVCHIFVLLTDWSEPWLVDTSIQNFVNPQTDPNVIAYGELINNQNTNGYVEFTINLDYKNNRKPTHIVVTAVASKYADYFTGGIGSTMYVDEFEFIY